MVKGILKYLHIVILAGLMLVTQDAWVQPKKTFRNLEAVVLANGHNLAEQYQKKIEADKRLSTVKWEKLPQFSATYRNITDGVFLTDDLLNNRTSLSLRLNQDLIRLFKIRPAKIQEAQAKLELAKRRLELTKDRGLYEFRNAYLNGLIFKTRMQFLAQLGDIYSKILTIKSAQYKYSETLLPDVLKIETRQLKYQSQLNYSANRFERTKSELAEYLNIHKELILWDDPDMGTPALELSYFLRQAEKSNLRIFSQKCMSVATYAQASSAAYEDLNLSLFAGIRYHGEDWAPSRSSPEIGARLSLPLFYPWLRSAKKARLTARGNAYAEASLASRTQLQTEVTSLYNEVNYLKSQQEIAKKQSELSREKLRIETLKTPDNRKNESVFKLEAELVEARLRTKVSKYKYLQAHYKLLYLSGISFAQQISGN